MDDLERILGYADAVDESAPINKVADELFVMSCWTPQFCTALIRAAEAAGGFSAQLGDPVPGHEISLALISPRLFEAVQYKIEVSNKTSQTIHQQLCLLVRFHQPHRHIQEFALSHPRIYRDTLNPT